MRHDLVSLKLFVAVAECGSLTRAAEREHLAVSAISKRLAELEDMAGVALLQRYPRGVALTPPGQSMLRHARLILQSFDRMDADLAEFAGGVRGEVRLHAVASALAQFLPAEIESFLRQYPGVRLSLEERTGAAIVRALLAGDAEIGVMLEPAPQGLAVYPGHADRLVIGVPAGHPLAGRASIGFADALDHPFVGPHADSSLAQLMAGAAKACGKRLDLRIQASSFDVMARLVEHRLGITLLPEKVLGERAAAGGIAIVALAEPWAERRFVIAVREADELGSIARALVEHLQRSAAEAQAAAG